MKNPHLSSSAERVGFFLLKSGTMQGCPPYNPPQHFIRGPSQCSKSLTRNKRHVDCKERSKAVFNHGWHDHVLRKSETRATKGNKWI